MPRRSRSAANASRRRPTSGRSGWSSTSCSSGAGRSPYPEAQEQGAARRGRRGAGAAQRGGRGRLPSAARHPTAAAAAPCAGISTPSSSPPCETSPIAGTPRPRRSPRISGGISRSSRFAPGRTASDIAPGGSRRGIAGRSRSRRRCCWRSSGLSRRRSDRHGPRPARRAPREEVTSFLVRLFESSDPTLARGASLTAQELLDEGVTRLRSDLAAEPEVRARLLHAMAASYVGLGLYSRALPLAQEALRLRRQTFPTRSAEVAASMDQLGELFRLEADFRRAEPLLQAALAARRAVLGPDDPAVIQSLGHLGRLLEDKGEFASAEGPFREALAASERRFGPDSPESAACLDDFGTNQSDLGREAKAIGLLRRALAIRERALGPDALGVAASLQSLGLHLDGGASTRSPLPRSNARSRSGRRSSGSRIRSSVRPRSISLASMTTRTASTPPRRRPESSLDVLRRALPEDHPKVGEALNMLGIIRTSRRDFAGAVPVFRELLARYRQRLGKEPSRHARAGEQPRDHAAPRRPGVRGGVAGARGPGRAARGQRSADRSPGARESRGDSRAGREAS